MISYNPLSLVDIFSDYQEIYESKNSAPLAFTTAYWPR